MSKKIISLSLLVFLIPILSGIYPEDKSIQQRERQAKEELVNGKPEMAYLIYAGILSEDSDRIDLYQQIGIAAYYTGNIDLSRDYLNQAIGYSAIDEDGLLILGDIYFKGGDHTRAEKTWKLATLDRQNAEEFSMRLIRSYLTTEIFSSAAEQMKNWLALDPENEMAIEMMGWVSIFDDTNDPEIFFDQVNSNENDHEDILSLIRTDPENNGSLTEQSIWWVKVGDSAKLHGRYEISSAAYGKSVELDPGNSRGWIKLALLKQSINMPADVEIANSIDTAGNDEEALHLIADFWYFNGQPEVSIIFLHKAINAGATDPQTYTRLGTILAEMGRVNEGLDYIKQAAELSGDSEGWNSLTIYCLNNGIYIREEGLPAARKALHLDPRSSVSWDLSGQVFYYLGDYITAEKHFMQSIQIDEHNYSAHLHLGYLYLAQNKLDLASRQLTIAALQDSDPEVSEMANSAMLNPE